MTLAQKKARENFKKAIEYRKKTGCSLKAAFAHIKGKHTVVKKVGAVKKKIVKKKVLISPLKKVAKKKAAPKKVAAKKPNLKYRGTLKSEGGKKMYKYSLGKKPTENTILNKIHKVKKDVDNLDEAQHKHMVNGLGKVSHHSMEAIKKELVAINVYSKEILIVGKMIINAKKEKRTKNYIAHLKNVQNKFKDLLKEAKIHLTQLKKHI